MTYSKKKLSSMYERCKHKQVNIFVLLNKLIVEARITK